MARSKLNGDQLGTTGGAWTTWSPTLTNISGGTQNYAKYIEIGNTVFCRFKYTMAGAGVSGEAIFSLPVATHADYSSSLSEALNGQSVLIDNGVAFYPGVCLWRSSTTVAVRYQNSTPNLVATSSTVPFTWASGDFIQAHFSYESA